MLAGYAEDVQKMKLGFVGLGIMGLPMALNLHRAGFPLAVYNRTPKSVERGLQVCKSPKEVAENADIIFTCVSDTIDVEEVIFGINGIIHGAKAGSIVVDMSTISPEATKDFSKRLAAKNIALLDAPCSGGEAGAIAGTLTFMVGGTKDAFARVKPYFEKMGKTIVHVGASGAGQVAKACNQIVIAVSIEAVSEALLLAEKCGVDGRKVREALMGGFAGSKVMEVHGNRMLNNDYKPGFKAKLHRKDMGIVIETAKHAKAPIPAATLATKHIDEAIAAGDGENDSSAIFKVLRKK
jgi:2-hydroxy-3-oxopropionate reductase